MLELPTSISDKFRNIAKIYKTRPQDLVGFSIIWILSCCVYYTAMFIVLPVVLEGQHPIVHFLVHFLLPHYILGGVLSNMVMFRMRASSIRNKILIQPVVKAPPTSMYEYSLVNGSSAGSGDDRRCQDSDYELKERTKFIGEHFVATPFQDEKLWHICASCEVFVPPKAWHCHQCQTCILRRDHHCVFTMGCVGEENHCNFLGLLFYLSVGCTLSAIFTIIYHIYFLDTLWWMFIIKAFVPFYSMFYDFSMINMLSGVTILGQLSAWGVFSFYMYIAFRGQTVADWSKVRCQTNPPKITFSYQNLKDFLGPNPFLRILNPFHSVICKSITTTPEESTAENRKGFWSGGGNSLNYRSYDI